MNENLLQKGKREDKIIRPQYIQFYLMAYIRRTSYSKKPILRQTWAVAL